MNLFWKEASTVILSALKKPSVNSKWNYDILTLQRSSQSSFMPNGHVFPGGVAELCDGDKVWIDYFSSFDLDVNNLGTQGGTLPPILSNEKGYLPKLLSLKITALRETFEETGLLLCFKKGQDTKNNKWVSNYVFEGLDSWRNKVQKDAKEFFNMCQNFDCCPDVNSLHLWSNWLTPTSMGKKRFDTLFFIACMNTVPQVIADDKEVENLSWKTPGDLLMLCNSENLWLPPPQVYEITRLMNIIDINYLSTFAKERAVLGCERWMPIHLKTADGSVSLLPGDEAYNVVDYSTPTKPEIVSITNEEFRKKSKVLHRMEFSGKTITKVVINDYSPTCGHKPPANEF